MLICSKVNHSKELENAAKEAFEMRNTTRSTARQAINDGYWATFLEEFERNKTWSEIVKDKVDKGFKGDD